MDIKAEQRATLASSLCYNEVVERRMVRNDQVLLDVHELVNGRKLQFVELTPQLLQTSLQELVDAVALVHAHLPTMTRAVPVTVCDVNLLRLDLLLLCSPLLPQLLSATNGRIKKQTSKLRRALK